MWNPLRMFWLQLENLVAGIPDWLIGLLALVGAALLALTVHAAVVGAVRRTLAGRQPALAQLLRRTKAPLRLALVVLALAIVLPVAPIDPRVARGLGHATHVAFIVLMGWCAVVGTEIFSDVYLRRFQLDAEDNLLARKHVTQIKILNRAADILIAVITLGAALMTFDTVRQYGVSLFASAGVAGLAVGLAARPLLANLVAGLQIAVAQPIRLDDVVIVEGEYGTVEDISTTFVTLKLWDWRRMVVPLSYFIEKPFQNWTRETSALIGTVYLYLDYLAPIEQLRDRLTVIAKQSPLWDGRVVSLQVSDATKDRTIEVRALVSARSASATWDLRCEVREKLIAFLRSDYPEALPRTRQSTTLVESADMPSLAPQHAGAIDGRS